MWGRSGSEWFQLVRSPTSFMSFQSRPNLLIWKRFKRKCPPCLPSPNATSPPPPPPHCWRRKLSSGAHETQARALPQSRTSQPADLSGRFQINLLLYLGHLFRDERRGEASPLRSVRDQFLRWGKRPRMWARQPCGFFCSWLLNSQATRFVSPNHDFPVK